MSDGAGGMRCPVDGATLVMSERSGVEIDYCPTCRGVWLDRGELDKVIERSEQSSSPPARTEPQHDSGRSSAHEHRYDQAPRTRKKSFLQELFD